MNCALEYVLPSPEANRPQLLRVEVVASDLKEAVCFRRRLLAASMMIDPYIFQDVQLSPQFAKEKAWDIMLVAEPGPWTEQADWVKTGRRAGLPVLLVTRLASPELPRGIAGTQIRWDRATPANLARGLVSLWSDCQCRLRHRSALFAAAKAARAEQMVH